jgi:predicted dehydrogenase
MSIPKIGIIGCGAITELYYLPALKKLRSILDNLILVDTNQERVEKIAEIYGVKKYTFDYNEILTEVDGVIIAVPHALHYCIAMDFLKKGVHVLCEKPLTTSPHEARELVSQASESRCELTVNNTRRLFPSYQKVKELLLQGAIGELVSLSYYEGHILNWPAVSAFRFSGGDCPRGVLLDFGAHALDAVCWWLGDKPAVVSCETDSFGGIDALTYIQLATAGCSGEIKLSWLSNFKSQYRIVGTEGAIEGGTEDAWVVQVKSMKGSSERIVLGEAEKDYYELADALMKNFTDVICCGQKPCIVVDEVIPSIDLIDDCYGIAKPFILPWYETLRSDND